MSYHQATGEYVTAAELPPEPTPEDVKRSEDIKANIATGVKWAPYAAALAIGALYLLVRND